MGFEAVALIGLLVVWISANMRVLERRAEHRALYIGDDYGRITLWDFTNMIRALPIDRDGKDELGSRLRVSKSKVAYGLFGLEKKGSLPLDQSGWTH